MSLDAADKKRITKAKKLFTQRKKGTYYINKVTRDEGAVFAEDEKLAELVLEKEIIENKIVSKMENDLLKHRGYDVETSAQNKLEKLLVETMDVLPLESHSELIRAISLVLDDLRKGKTRLVEGLK